MTRRWYNRRQRRRWRRYKRGRVVRVERRGRRDPLRAEDEVALHWEAVAMHQRVGTYWHMLPEAAQGRKAIWEAVNPHSGKRRLDEAFPHELRETTRENEMMIRFKSGAALHIVGSDNFNSLVGSP